MIDKCLISKEIISLRNKDEAKQRKIDGLLKLIQTKNNEIESLKLDIQQQQVINTTPRVKQSLVEQLNNSSDVCISLSLFLTINFLLL
jgi:hypothetical protein